MLRVYHFILDHRLGGPHVYVDTLRKALDGKIESIVVTTGRGPMTNMALLNFRHVWAPLYAVEMIANIAWLVSAVLLGRIKRQATIFNVHGGANLAPIVAARIVGMPVVWHLHETTTRYRCLVNVGKWLLAGHPHRLIVVAKKAKEVYEAQDAVHIPAAIDTTFWTPDAVGEKEIGACDWGDTIQGIAQPLRVLAIGNLNPLKGIDILLEAMAKVDQPWHLKIVGGELRTHRDYADKLHRRAREIELLKKGCAIDFLGWQEKPRVRALLACCDVYVLPSRSEACPIALLEAMAMGKVCIAADVGDVKDVLQVEEKNIVFEAMDYFDLARLIDSIYLMRHSLELQIISKKNKDIVSKYHSLSRFSSLHLAQYCSL